MRLTGTAIERVEDAALLRGEGRFADDMPRDAATAEAAFVRAPHAHAKILSIDTT